MAPSELLSTLKAPEPPCAIPVELQAYVSNLEALLNRAMAMVAQLSIENAKLHARLDVAEAKIAKLTEENAKLRVQNQQLRDEVAVLKGVKGKPVIKKNAALGADPDADDDDEGPPDGAPPKRPGSEKRSKSATLKYHHKRVVAPGRAVPPGSVFKGYAEWGVQDMAIAANNTLVQMEIWVTPQGETLRGELPVEYADCHFGPEIRTYVLFQHHHCHVTQPRLLEQLRQFGIDISSGQLDALLSKDAEFFIGECSDLVRTGLECTPAVTVDDSGARHMGRNAVVTVISGPAFTYFQTTFSKSRINFLTVLLGGTPSYLVNEAALSYMREQDLHQEVIAALAGSRGQYGATKRWLEALLAHHGVTAVEPRRTVTEALLWGALSVLMSTSIAIVSDGARQFEVGVHGRCWVHAARLVLTLHPGCEEHRLEQARVLDEIRVFYRQLKRYKRAPDPALVEPIEARFDELFSQETSFESLNEQLKRLREFKSDLLLVLSRPEVPLHTNMSESDIRDFVLKRKISGGTRADLGLRCRDAFAALKKTCRKLGVSFWAYLRDRLLRNEDIPPLSDLIWQRMAVQA